MRKGEKGERARGRERRRKSERGREKIYANVCLEFYAMSQ